MKLVHLLLLSGGACNAAFSRQVNPAKKYNILLIMADDLGYNDVSWHNKDMLMPSLDALARQGVILEQSYSQQVCTPSRAALLTGKYPFHIGRQKRALKPLQPTGLSIKHTTLPQQLKRLGYNTHMVGKWHLGYCSKAYTPTQRGFDSFLGFYLGSQEYFTHDRVYKKKETDMSSYLDFRENEEPTTKYNNIYSTEVFRDRTIDILDEVKAARDLNAYQNYHPFFIYLSLQATHSPLQARLSTLQKIKRTDNFARDIYKAMVLDMDEAVEKVVNRLKENNLYNDTIIIFTSDNGAAISHGGGSNFPLRGTKGTLFEGGTRAVGFVHAAPEILEKTGYRNHRLIHMTDWMPTLLKLAGYAGDPVEDLDLDGVDQWQSISSNASDSRTEMVYNLKEGPSGAIRVGDYKLLFGKKFNKQGWYDIDSLAIKCNKLNKDKKQQRKQLEQLKKMKKSKLTKKYLAALQRKSRKLRSSSKMLRRRQARKKSKKQKKKKNKKDQSLISDEKIAKIWKNWLPQPSLFTQTLIRWQLSNCSFEDFTRIGHYKDNSLKQRPFSLFGKAEDMVSVSEPLASLINPFYFTTEDEDAEFEEEEHQISRFYDDTSFTDQFDNVESALFNVRDDPEERVDLKLQHVEIFRQLRSRVKFHMSTMQPADFPQSNDAGHPRFFNGTFSPGWCQPK